MTHPCCIIVCVGNNEKGNDMNHITIAKGLLGRRIRIANAWLEQKNPEVVVCVTCPYCQTWNDVEPEFIDEDAECVVGDVRTWAGVAWSEHTKWCGDCGEMFLANSGGEDIDAD